MSQHVESIVEAVRKLDLAERQELTAALAAIDAPRLDVSSSRKQLVSTIKGKYRHIPTSSESFINRKKEDMALESRS